MSYRPHNASTPPPLPGARPLAPSTLDTLVSKVRSTYADVRRKVSEEIRQQRSCPRNGCAEQNPVAARFCRRCGVTLTTAPDPSRTRL